MRLIAYILPILWILIGLFWYFPSQQERCCQSIGEVEILEGQESEAPGTSSQQEVPTLPEYYQFGEVSPINETQLASRLQSRYANLDENEILEIRGRYYGSESVPEGQENMGLARAQYLRGLLGSEVDETKIALSAFRIGDSLATGGIYFRGVDLNSITSETPSVKEIDDRAEMRFASGADQKIDDPVIDQYLADVAERVISSGERIRLTGHTDSQSSAEFNFDLARRRANAIRDILIAKGVNPSQIDVLSRGETEPVASNSTEAGKALNRRVELQVIN